MSVPVRPVVISEFGPPALACIRSWGEGGFPAGMICIGRERHWQPDSKYLAGHAFISSDELYTRSGIGIINAFLREFDATGLLCISEQIACWLDENRSSLHAGAALWNPGSRVIRDLLSKKNQVQTAREVGFDILPTYCIDSRTISRAEFDSKDFPLCLRPAEATKISPSFKVRIVHSFGDLIQFVGSLHLMDTCILAQPFKDLPNLVVHGARKQSGETFGLQGFLVDRKFQGVTLTIRPISIDDSLRRKCIQFTERFDITGTYHFEFLVEPNQSKHYFLEINSRLGGTTAKVYACGYNEPLMALQAYGIQGADNNRIKDTVASSKHALVKHSWHALRGRLTPLDHPAETVSRRILKNTYALLRYGDEVLSFRDVRGSLSFYEAMIRSTLFHR